MAGEVKSYRRADGTVVKGYKRKGGKPKKKRAIERSGEQAIRQAKDDVSWSKANVTGVRWERQLETYHVDLTTGERSHSPAALVLKTTDQFSERDRRELQGIIDRTARRDEVGRLVNEIQVKAAVNRRAAAMSRKKGGGVIRPVGPPKKLTASRGTTDESTPTLRPKSDTEAPLMTLDEILAKLKAYNESVADPSALTDEELTSRLAEGREALVAFDAYRSQEGGAEVTAELVEVATATRTGYDAVGTQIEANAAEATSLADAVDAVFDGIDLSDAEELPAGDEGADDGADDGGDPEVDAADLTEAELLTAGRSIVYQRPPAAALTADPTEGAAPAPAVEHAAEFLVASAGQPTPHAVGRPTTNFAGETVSTADQPLALAEAVAISAQEMLTAGRMRGDGRNGLVAARFPGRGHRSTIGRDLNPDGVAALAAAAAGVGSSEHLTAAAGVEPIEYSYGFAGQGVSASMPVWDSRVRHSTTRSRFAIRLRESLTDYEPADPAADYPDGMGAWTLANDQAGDTKVDPATPNEPGTKTFEIGAFYRSVEITNLEALTDPEKLNQWLNLGGVAFKRALERDNIDTMLTLPGAIYIEQSAGQYGLTGTTREVVPILREQIEELEHQEGFENGLGYELITLNWARTAVANDLWRRNTDSYDQQSGPVEKFLKDDLDIDLVLSAVGSSGRRSGYTWLEMPPLPTTGGFEAGEGGAAGTITWGTHERTPNRLDYILAPKGTLQAVDRGFLQVGVAPWSDGVGSVIRDTSTAYSNTFRVFWEIVKTLFSTGMPYIVGRITDLNDDGAGVGTHDPIVPAS